MSRPRLLLPDKGPPGFARPTLRRIFAAFRRLDEERGLTLGTAGAERQTRR